MAETLEDLLKIKDEYHEKIRAVGEGVIKNLLKDFMDRHPYVHQLRWDQYTPYFNDGDACVFNVYDTYVSFNDADMVRELADKHECWETEYVGGEERYKYIRPLTDEEILSEAGERGDGFFGSWDLKDNTDFVKDFNKVSVLLDKSEDILEEVFGDHATVIVSRDRIDVEECSHD